MATPSTQSAQWTLHTIKSTHRYVLFGALLAIVLLAVSIWRSYQHPIVVMSAQEKAAGTDFSIAGAIHQPSTKAPQPAASGAPSYEQSRNLLALVQSAEGKNDVNSLTLRARAFNECRILTVSPNFFGGLDATGEQVYGERLPIVKQYVQDYLGRCGDLAQVNKPRAADAKAALQEAAAAGSLWAKATLFNTESREMSQSERDSRLAEILSSHDGEAIGAIADTMARPLGESQYSDLAGDPLHGYAWQLVSCDFGRDCTAAGALMRQACIFGGMCGTASNWRDYLQQSVLTAQEFVQVEQIEQTIRLATQSYQH